MGDLAEDRVYAGGGDESLLFVACGQGLVRVAVSGDMVGTFGLATRTDARDVAADEDRIVLGTADSFRVGSDASELRDTGLGPTAAVGIDEDGWVMGASDGGIHRETENGTRYLGQLDNVQAISPPLIATSEGVFLLEDLSSAGLEKVQDVAARPVPRAAAAAGLFRLGNGWIEENPGDATVVATREMTEGAAVIDGTFHRLDDGAWTTRSLPVDEPIADVLLGPAIYVITSEGTLLIDAGSGWRSRSLGISDVRAMALQRGLA